MTSYADMLADAVDRILAPALDEAGFRRKSRRSGEWTRDNHLQVRVQRDSKANDPYSGGAFTLEFEVSSDGRFGHKLAGRVLLEQLFDAGQRGRFLALRNDLAQRWGEPPPNHLATIPEFLHEQYLKHFVVAPELERQFGIRYRSAVEADQWAALIAGELESLLRRADGLSATEVYLGKALDW